MNFSQMHERLRLDLLRRIQRGTLSVSLLARQTGFGQSHLSNFLRRKRQLSLEALDRVLAAQHLSASDLLPSQTNAAWAEGSDPHSVPVVSHAAAMCDPVFRPGAIQRMLELPAGVLEQARPRASNSRRAWTRFAAIRVSAGDSAAMEPLLLPDGVAVLDRHYNSLQQYRPAHPNLYAVRHDAHLKLRHADFQAGRLLLLPCSRAAPVEAIIPGPGESPGELIVGRVVMVMNEL